MEIYIADIEELLKNFKPYQESIRTIKGRKNDFNQQMGKIRSEMEQIISLAQNQIVLGNNTQESQQQRFNQLQEQATELQYQFQEDITNLQNEELEKSLSQIKEIVTEWCEYEKIPLIANRNTMLYVSDKYDVTPRLLNVMKEKGVYNEFNEEEFIDAELEIQE